jgi:hypothetical protein
LIRWFGLAAWLAELGEIGWRNIGNVAGGPEATMELATDWDGAMLHMLTATIARSPIVVRRTPALLPAGFDEVDLAILNWIAAEARQLRTRFALM